MVSKKSAVTLAIEQRCFWNYKKQCFLTSKYMLIASKTAVRGTLFWVIMEASWFQNISQNGQYFNHESQPQNHGCHHGECTKMIHSIPNNEILLVEPPSLVSHVPITTRTTVVCRFLASQQVPDHYYCPYATTYTKSTCVVTCVPRSPIPSPTMRIYL